jgi:hypothetical protein
MNSNVLLRAKLVAEMVNQNYQEGRHDRCKLWVYRHIVYPQMPISQRTFSYYLKIAKEQEQITKEQEQINPKRSI